jgi:hypothetical protein
MNWIRTVVTIAILLGLAILSIDAAAVLLCTAQGVPSCSW